MLYYIIGIVIGIILSDLTTLRARGECLSTSMYGKMTVCEVNCPLQNRNCECSRNYDICNFRMEIDELLTFVSYQTNEVKNEVRTRTLPGVIFNINNDGVEVPRQIVGNKCEKSNSSCTLPNYVDGRTYRLIRTINAQFPGPTLIVSENQFLNVTVQNNMLSSTTGIHWHGLHQHNTGFMDGVSSITQCGIQPGTSFNYLFKAAPSGSFWYHSHTGAQRTDGLMGGIIIRELPELEAKIRSKLKNEFGIPHYADLPALHTITIQDWFPETSMQNFESVSSGVGFFPSETEGVVPSPDDKVYESVPTYDLGRAAPMPFYAALINGKGRNSKVNFVNTRLKVFYIVRGNTYRFRLIGTQGLYPYRLSIDNHRLTVVATDGYWIEPIKNVNYIILHSGERYDFFLDATEAEGSNFAIRVETMEAIIKGHVPYKNAGNEVQAILHYNTSTGSNKIPSTMYKNIINNSIPWNCAQQQNCRASNCPFENFHPSYGIQCINAFNFHLLIETKSINLPEATTENCEKGIQNPDEKCIHFLNFNSENTLASINGRSMALPHSPPLIQPEQFYRGTNLCKNITGTCNSYESCLCTHVLNIPFNKTIQFVITNIGTSYQAHPVHMHAHSYFIIYMGYPSYHKENGTIKSANPDIKCLDRKSNSEIPLKAQSCSVPRWEKQSRIKSFKITNKTPRKDTLMVPAGGYMVINIISDNPGLWYMHCHIEVHNLQGMDLVLNIAPDHLVKPPSDIGKCGNFHFKPDNHFFDFANDT